MKYKKWLVLILTIIITFNIYVKTKDNDIYYLNIGDESATFGYASDIVSKFRSDGNLEKYVEFYYDDIRITDLTNIIKNNEYIYVNDKRQTIENALIKADLITLSIGSNDLEYGLLTKDKDELYDYIDTLLNDFDILLTEIRNYSKEDIFLLSFNETNDYVKYFNKKLESLCNKKKIIFIKETKYDIAPSILNKFTFKG